MCKLHSRGTGLIRLMRARRGNAGALIWRSALSGVLLAAFLFASVRSNDAMTAQLVASGLSQPLFVCAAPGDVNHIYIVEQTGKVRRFDLTTNSFDAAPFIDLAGKIVTSGEQGLLGLAFDPNYASNGRFYLNLVVPGGSFGNGTTHVSMFTASSSPSPTASPTATPKKKKHKKKHPTPTPVPNGEVVLLSFDHPEANHNGGWIGFSPRANDDHNLYIATGDGGNGYDQGTGHIEPGGNAQNKTTLLGKMLRIHVDPVTGTASIPPANPFAGATGSTRKEIFDYGLRNPFRNSFDRQNGTMFMGDVGQATREEVDVQPASNPGGGENYGWRLREGTIATPSSVGGPPPTGNVEPILDYDHSVGQTIIGGYVYRGSAIPALQGKYVFGDYAAGKIFTLDFNGTTASNFSDITAVLFPSGGLSNPSSFGEDANGELYITDIGSGQVFKIVP
jgi:glucose/arabinose dehydrogenase